MKKLDEKTKEAYKRLCSNCFHSEPHICYFPRGLNEDGGIIYDKIKTVCGKESGISPITSTGEDCPYFRSK